jgi:hypothetical protein
MANRQAGREEMLISPMLGSGLTEDPAMPVRIRAVAGGGRA